MRVIDTSIWIELLTRGKLLAEARSAVDRLDDCYVPAMVRYELAKWSLRVLSEDAANSVLSLLTECNSLDMDAIVAEEAAQLSSRHKLHATDAIIYATARLHDAPLFTCDAHFKGLPGVEYFEKS
jgi:predicted nucleic acid-binding protein